MNTTNHYKILRIIFISGFSLQLLLTFIPSVEVNKLKVFGFDNQFLKNETYSDKDTIGLLLQVNPLLGLFFIAVFILQIIFIILAIKYPRRWVFLSGAGLACLSFIGWLFMPKASNTTILVIPALLSWCAMFAKMTGFFIHPPEGELSPVDKSPPLTSNIRME
jgi:MFS family permease